MSGPTDKDLVGKSPAGKDLPDEQQFEEYLKGGSSVSQQYRQLRSSEVPAELDRLVLRQAQEAVKTTRPAKSRVWTRWTAPLAVAASAVLVLSIVIQSGVQKQEVLLEVPASAPAPAAPATMEAERNSEALDEDASVNGIAQPQFESIPEAPRAAPDERAAPAYVPPAYASPAEPPPPKFDMPQPELRRERLAAPASQMAANSQAQGVVEADRAAKVLSAEAAHKAEEAHDVEEIAITGHRTSRGAQPQAAGPRGTVAVPRPVSAVVDSSSTREASEQLPQYSDPELWLRDIRKLRQQDKQEEADREWRRFRAAFPDHPVAEKDKARSP